MKFGFDVDDTLINLREHAFHIYNKKLNSNVPLENFRALKSLEIHEAFGLSAQQGGEMWNSLLEEIYYTNCRPFPHSVETLKRLVDLGHEVFYITARESKHQDATKKWLIENGFPVKDNHFFCGMRDVEKLNIITELQLDYYFDDKPAVLENMLELPIKIYAKDNSYNKQIELPRITCWSELQVIIEQDKKDN
jgi:5'(3')-deoxyribonucleotidase